MELNTPPPLLPQSGPAIRKYHSRRGKELRGDPALRPGGEAFASIVTSYLPLVYGIATRLVPEDAIAVERICNSAFELLAVKWPRVLKGNCSALTLIAYFLFRAAVDASLRERKRMRLKKPAKGSSAAEYAQLFRRYFLFGKKAQRCVLIFKILADPSAVDSPKVRKLELCGEKAVRKLGKQLRKTSLGVNLEATLAALPVDAPSHLESSIIEGMRRWTVTAPTAPLSRATILLWRWRALRTFFKRVLAAVGATVCVAGIFLSIFIYLAQRGHFLMFFWTMEQRETVKKHPELARPGKPWPLTQEDRARVPDQAPRSTHELFRHTNIWLAKLSFTEEQWEDVQADRIERVPNLFEDNKINLRNPKAKRSGLAGALGFDFNWVEAQFEFAGLQFTNVAARYRGNGTYVSSLYGPKQSFKVDTDKFVKQQLLAGIDELNFVNSVPDSSFMHDTLAHRLFRDLGAHSPRTTYAYLTVDAEGKWEDQPIGLYTVIENIDKRFAEDRWGTKKVPIFKPVTYELFHDLGNDWKEYAEIYDLKTDAAPEQLQRVIDFAQLVSHASDEEFARRLAGFLDIEEFASYLATTVLLSSYDGFLCNGQNFFLYMDPETEKFGFIGWDQDHSWGSFGLVGTPQQRENASIWEPWVVTYDFKFLKRVIEVPAFRETYRAKLEYALENIFTEERLYAQIDEISSAIRPAVAADSQYRLNRFDIAVNDERIDQPHNGRSDGPDSPVHQIKPFIAARIKSVRAQLDGESEGARVGMRR